MCLFRLAHLLWFFLFLSNEVVERLTKTQPETIGSASRIEGVTPAAIDLILIKIKKAEIKSEKVNA